MRIYYLALGLLALLGQDQTESKSTREPEVVRVLAIHATQTDGAARTLDPSLEPLRDFLETLPYNTFSEIAFHEIEAYYGLETSAKLNDRYEYVIHPRELTEHGEILFDCHIDLTGDDSTVEALRVSGRATRGQGAVFRGLAMPQGELIVVMSIARAEQASGGDGGSGTQEGGGTGEAVQGEAGPNVAGEGGQQEAGQETKPGDSALEPPTPEEEPAEVLLPPRRGALTGVDENAIPPDLATIEGILRALEEQDIQEQKSARNRRYDVVIQGDWW